MLLGVFAMPAHSHVIIARMLTLAPHVLPHTSSWQAAPVFLGLTVPPDIILRRTTSVAILNVQ